MHLTPLTPAPPTAPATSAAGRSVVVFQAAWGVLAVAAAALLWVLVGVWASQPEMNDRFLIPLASAWVAYRLGPRWRETVARPSPLGLVPVMLGAAAFPVAWYLLVQVGPRVILLWWLLAALVLAAFGLAVLQNGWRRARLLVFPLAFTFFALPAPDLVMAPLQRALQGGTTTAAAAALTGLGIPVERHGYVLALPSGDLGVVEACSGVRSVSALTAIAVLVAHLRYFGLARGAVLLALSFGIIVVSNAARVITSGLLQEYVGRWAIEGWYHEVLGAMVVLVGLALIVGTSTLLVRSKQEDDGPALAAPPVTVRPARGGSLALALFAAAAVGCVWCEQFRQAHREEVRLEQLPYEVAGWKGRDEAIPAGVTEMLKCDQIVLRVFTDSLGREVHAYVMFWATPASTAHIHHPDVCWPKRGWQVTRGDVRPIPLGEGRSPLPVSSRLYTDEADRRQLVYYWTQRGTEVLPDGAEPAGTVAGEYAWIADLLRGRQPMARQARLSVLLGTDVSGSVEQLERKLQEFTAAWAREVYRQCPWAVPAPAADTSRKKDESPGAARL